MTLFLEVKSFFSSFYLKTLFYNILNLAEIMSFCLFWHDPRVII